MAGSLASEATPFFERLCPAMTAITLISSSLANKARNVFNEAADC
jgi:hypothetical protein